MSLFSAGASLANTAITNKTNQEIARNQRNLDYQNFQQEMGFAREQFDYQKEMDDYNKALQQQIFEREDTAVSRLIADAQRNGINPLTALNANQMQTSSNLLSSGASTSIPHANPTAGYTHQSADLSSLGNILGDVMNIARGVQEVKGMKIDNMSKNAVYNLQVKTMLPQIVKSYNEAFKSSAELRSMLSDENFKNFYGITDSMPEKEKITRIIMKDVFNLSNSGTSSPTRTEDVDGKRLERTLDNVLNFKGSTSSERIYRSADMSKDLIMSIINSLL